MSQIVATPLWRKWGLGSPPGLPNLQSAISGVKTPRLWNVLYTVGKVLKCRCRKWPRMGHSDICSTCYVWKKGRESNCQFDSRPRCVQAECDTPLESSQGELQVCFKPHLNRRFEQGVMSYQNLGSPNRGSFGIVSGFPLGSPRTKSHLDVAPVEWCRL
jgi:hypothetical protein